MIISFGNYCVQIIERICTHTKKYTDLSVCWYEERKKHVNTIEFAVQLTNKIKSSPQNQIKNVIGVTSTVTKQNIFNSPSKPVPLHLIIESLFECQQTKTAGGYSLHGVFTAANQSFLFWHFHQHAPRVAQYASRMSKQILYLLQELSDTRGKY